MALPNLKSKGKQDGLGGITCKTTNPKPRFYSKIGLRGVLYCSHEDRIDDSLSVQFIQ